MIHYAICSTQRSGSSLLCHMVRQTNALGRPMEFFSEPRVKAFMEEWGVNDSSSFMAELKRQRSTRNGVFGFKAHYHQFEWLWAFTAVSEVLPDLKYVHIDRRDRLSQAVSLAIARQTGAFSSTHTSRTEPVYRFEDVRSAMLLLVDENRAWDRYLTERGVTPLRVTYEGLIEDVDATVRRVAEFLGVPTDFAQVELERSPIERQGDATNLEWTERAQEDAAGLRGDAMIGDWWPA